MCTLTCAHNQSKIIQYMIILGLSEYGIHAYLQPYTHKAQTYVHLDSPTAPCACCPRKVLYNTSLNYYCVATLTGYNYFAVIMLFPSLLCHSRIPPSVEYHYIGQAHTEVHPIN